MIRVLKYENSEFSLTEFADHKIPEYAILSHTWGHDGEEITFKDIIDRTGKTKKGYEKLQFCATQSKADGLHWFWIDTCCINKHDKAELSRSINSMYRWYRNAARCYVYLPDVSTRERERDGYSRDAWESDFRKSRWFTRGWTVQELLAPASVEFFSRERHRLGDKSSLMRQIGEITNISPIALQGDPLSQFSINERLQWMEHRQTKLEEDMVYSLLGIFGVYILPVYGEGKAKALDRLMDEFHKSQKCIQDLRLTDPCDDKKRIEDTKGGLLEDSCQWILDNSDFQQWRNSQENRLLWIKGDPGKGKTMLLCSIINGLKSFIAKSNLLSFFFCQATDSRINTAMGVLRGLIYLLVNQQPSLILHARKKYEQAGKTIFEDANAWVALSEIFTNILQDPSLNCTYLVVDALDECVVDLPKLLDFIVQTLPVSARIKWIVSSRNWPSIEKELDTATQKVRLCLELNEESVSAAIKIYIQFKVDWLAKRNRYSSNTQETVQRYLSLNAKGTFLWVALVCQELSNISGWKAQNKLTAFPPGLDALYRRMMDQICNSDDTELCKSILAVVSVVYRPITLEELASVVDMPDGVSGDYEALAEIIGLCGSFLTLRECTISFVHQSAKDYLVEHASAEIFPDGRTEEQQRIVSRSIEAMDKALQRDVYGLRHPGCSIDKIEHPNPDPLARIRYACVYWIDHICEIDRSLHYQAGLYDNGTIDLFIKKHFLHWLEALSLIRSMSSGVVMIRKLENLAAVSISSLTIIQSLVLS
jgi:hypothetical protein